MKDSTNKVSALEGVARVARARVRDALKSTIERELVVVAEEVGPRHSKFEHVVQEIRNAAAAERDDKSLANSMWGPDKEERVREFAERLANLKKAS